MKKLFERMGGVESVYAAFRFLTLIPLGPKKLSPEALSWSSAHFPLVGISIGLLMSLCFWCFGPCGLWGAIALSLGVGVCITGALHEDGLADTADAMGGGDQKEKILLILKDSRVGTFGASALILSFMIRWSLLAHLSGAAPVGFVLSQGLSRLPAVWMMCALPYIMTKDSRSKMLFCTGLGPFYVAVAWVCILMSVSVLSCWLALSTAVLMGGALVVTTKILSHFFMEKIGGITGDFLGATEQVGEIVVLMVLAAVN